MIGVKLWGDETMAIAPSARDSLRGDFLWY